MDKNIFAVDIGGSKLICGVLTQNGNILQMYQAQYPEKYSLETITGLICEGFEYLKSYSCSYCGIAVPGLCDYERGTWLYSPFSGIANVPITQMISDITGLPAVADNDVNASALAEKYFGVCTDISDFLWITVSNGIGGGLFIDGKLYRGQNLNAGEIGHFIVEENRGRRCGCGNYGCLEAMASGAAISAIYRQRSGKDISAKEIADLARAGNEEALGVWKEAGAYIGKAASYAVNLLGLDTVVLGGGAAESFDLLLSSAQMAVERFAFLKANPNIKLLHSAPGRYAALKGCVALVLEHRKHK